MSSKFSFKSFTTFILVWTFVVLIVSGVMLFVSPPGRVAHWDNWTLGALTKEGWQEVHVLMAIVFLVGGLFHLLKFNWKVFTHYLKRRATGTHHRKEALLSLALFVVVLCGTLYGLPPFSWVTSWGETVKSSWEDPGLAPPTPHFELESLEKAAQSLGLEASQAQSILQAQNLAVESPTQTLQSIADDNGVSPQDIYSELISGSGRRPTQSLNAPGLGRRSLEEVAGQMGIPVDTLLARLADRGVVATPQQTMKEVADEMNLSPHDLLTLLQQ